MPVRDEPGYAHIPAGPPTFGPTGTNTTPPGGPAQPPGGGNQYPTPGVTVGIPGIQSGGTSGTDDVHGFAGSYGVNFPPEVIKVMNKAFDEGMMSGSANPGQWAWDALRGTDWFKQSYSYYDAGQSNNLYGSWGGFIAWKNQVSQVTQDMLGRPAYDWEIAGWAKSGRTPEWVQKNYSKQASLGTLSDPVKGLFSTDELSQMQAGSVTGIQLGAFAEWASSAIPLLQQEGLPINRASLEAAWHAGTDPVQYARGQAGISGKFTNAGTVLNPALLALFTPAEQAELIQTANGVVTPNGAVLMDKASTFSQYMNASFTYYGTNTFSREQMEQMWANGVPASKIAHDASNAEQAAQQAAAENRALQQRVATATADIEAHKQDYNFALSTQGPVGQQGISAEDEQNIALQMAGRGNTPGAKLQKAIDDAMLRMKANFSGTLANLDRNGYGYALGKPDVGA